MGTEVIGIATLVVRGQEFDVTASLHPGSGHDKPSVSFATKYNDQTVFSTTIDGLYDQLMAKTKRAKVEINVPFRTAGTLNLGTVTSLNRGTGNPVVRWENGTTDRDYRIAFGETYFPADMSAELQSEYLALKETAWTAERKFAEFRRSHSFNLRDAIEKAVTEAEVK